MNEPSQRQSYFGSHLTPSTIRSTYLTFAARLLFASSLIVILALSFGCAKRASDRELPGVEESWQKALNLFERERYYQAQQLLRDFVLNYPGSIMIDSAQFYLGRATFELEDYLVAAEEFKRVITNYPFSKLAGDAAYWEARSYYVQAPGYQLDQTFTTQALDAFQRYLEEYPGHVLQDSAYALIARSRDKLAHKEFAAARLYHDLGEYASVVLYADEILANYYDTQWAAPAQFLKARSFDALHDVTRARREYQAYLDKYPQGDRADTARRALAALPPPSEVGSSTTPPAP